MTQDIDVVIEPIKADSKLDELVADFAASDFLFNEDAMRNAVKAGTLFQLLDEKECLKTDVYPS